MRSRRMRFLPIMLILLFLCSAPGYGAGLFDGLLPASTPTEPAGDGLNGGGLFDGLLPASTPTESAGDGLNGGGLFDAFLPVQTSTPEPADLPEYGVSAGIDASFEAAFASLAESMSISESGGNMLLTISGIEYRSFLAALIQIDPADFASVSYDSRTCTVSFTIPGTAGASVQHSSAAVDSNVVGQDNEASVKYCSDCFDGECTECFGSGYMDCTAYGCLGGSCMICFDGYETIMSGMDVREVRCRTCGGDEECNTCRGRGEVKCYKCSNGRCRTCGGDGKL